MTAWPETLPVYPLVDGFRETAPDTALRTDMEQGPAKVRRRTTAGVRTLAATYLMSKTQVATLETFYGDTLQGGVFTFSFTHPRSGSAITCRFVKAPEYAAMDGTFFKIALVLEVLP